ncbi:hypothetical protein DFR41_11758 [Pseudacidovorax intermedius]|uniref:Tli3-like domain-containing protein n=1 Tax=Pseudacidovorax intermedius TaxID=433924 RepID=A0A370F4F9_9BURK|nr:hypothetical protein [Pseudacidovorax intermedius]RDI17332.1 hypothetical protein DFR41_11758 [Pseudacidovorax intermedius]
MGKLTWGAVRRSAIAASALLLGACGLRGVAPAQAQSAKPEPAPVVIYRIDDHRYFEVTPRNDCYGDMIYFVDTAKGIRSSVVKFDPVMNRTKLIIDAANDDYLIGPVTRGGNTNCSSGGGACGSDKMPYSTDGGQTWQLAAHPGWGDDLMLSGPNAYHSYVNQARITTTLDLSTSPTTRNANWRYLPGFAFSPRKLPADTTVVCKAAVQGSFQ